MKTSRQLNQGREAMAKLRAARREAGLSSNTTAIETHRRWRGLPEPTRPEPKACECCDGPPSGRGRLHLDHDHETGKFRGWLCSRCNLGIGSLGDTYEGVTRGLDYLLRNG